MVMDGNSIVKSTKELGFHRAIKTFFDEQRDEKSCDKNLSRIDNNTDNKVAEITCRFTHFERTETLNQKRLPSPQRVEVST